MKKLVAVLTAFSLALGCIVFAACAPQRSGEDIAAQSVTLDKTQLSLAVGESTTLTATVFPEDAADKTVTWSSSDEDIATVESGTVTALDAHIVTCPTHIAGMPVAVNLCCHALRHAHGRLEGRVEND